MTDGIQGLLLPSLFCLLGLGVYFAAVILTDRSQSLPKYRFIGYGFFVLAVLSSLPNLWAILNPDTGRIYRLSLGGGRAVKAFYASFYVPILILIAVAAFDKFKSLQTFEE
jgi:hypothetical protein